MLASRPIKLGSVSFEKYDVFDEDPKKDTEVQKSLVRSYREAIRRNSRTLKKKHRDNKNIILTSLMLFAYVMVMTAVVGAITQPGAWPFPTS